MTATREEINAWRAEEDIGPVEGPSLAELFASMNPTWRGLARNEADRLLTLPNGEPSRSPRIDTGD